MVLHVFYTFLSWLTPSPPFSEKCGNANNGERKCAKVVHLAAKKYYVDKKIFKPVQLLCDDARDLAKYYKKTAKKNKCKSKALRAFGSTIKYIVPKLNKLILKRLKIPCPPSNIK